MSVIFSHLIPVDAFSVIDWQRSSEWELNFLSAAPVSTGEYTGQVSLTAIWQSGFFGQPDSEVFASQLSDHPTTKLPSRVNQNIRVARYALSWHKHWQDIARMQSVGKSRGDLSCPSALTHPLSQAWTIKSQNARKFNFASGDFNMSKEPSVLYAIQSFT